jgi:hypothetical protein
MSAGVLPTLAKKTQGWGNLGGEGAAKTTRKGGPAPQVVGNGRRIVNIKKVGVTLFTVLIFWTETLESKGFYPSEQRHFSAEDISVEKPVPIPDSVLTILREDEMVRIALANESIAAENIPLSWFSASAIQLSSPKNVDIVVMGEGSLHGSNVTTFWVFCATPHGYKLVLTAPAHDLIVKSTRWKGHRDIELTSMTAVQTSTVLFRFDGERYTKRTVRSKPIQ